MGITSSIGKILNDITGATSAAKQNNAYQKEFAQNAHQWEVEDLKKAGLNPVLSANGGASASGGGTSNSSSINPIETAIGAWNGYEQALNTGADTNRKNAETANLEADTLLKEYQKLKIMAETAKTKTEKEEIEKLMDAKLKEIQTNTKLAEIQTKTEKVDLNEEDVLNIMGIPVYNHKHAKSHRGENIK